MSNQTLLSDRMQSCLVFAARYAHDRNTGAAQMVISTIIDNWDGLRPDIKAQIQKEAKEATCNFEDWRKLSAMDAGQ